MMTHCYVRKMLIVRIPNSTVSMLNTTSSTYIKKYKPTTAPMEKPSLRKKRQLSVQDGRAADILVKLVSVVEIYRQ